MKNIIKSDLYYFFHNKLFFCFSIVLSIFLAFQGMINDYTSFESTPSAIYVNGFKAFYYVAANVLLIGIAMNNFFKNGMIVNQFNQYRDKRKPFLGLSIAATSVPLILMLPVIIMFFILTFVNGIQGEGVALFNHASAQPMKYLVLLLIEGLFHFIAFSAEMVMLSYLFKSEKKGIVAACVFELVFMFISMILIEGNSNETLERFFTSFSSVFSMLSIPELAIKYGDQEYALNNFELYAEPLICALLKLAIIYILIKTKRTER